MASSNQHQRGRDAKTGQFVPVDVAKRRPATTVVEKYKTGKNGPKN